MRHWKEDTDTAVSPVLATILLVAIAVVLSAVVYSTVTLARTEKPTALSLTPATQTGATRTLTIASATPGMHWEVVALALDGNVLAYDGALATDGTWCKLDAAAACVPTAGFDPGASVVAGDQIRVAHASIAGMTLTLRDAHANLLLSSMIVR